MIFLVDNGSMKPAAYKNLCTIASSLSDEIGEKVVPAPLLHADKIPVEDLPGEKVKLLEAAITEAYNAGERCFVVIPLFFGPSGALIDYLPRRLSILQKRCPNLQVQILNPMFKSPQDGGAELAAILKERTQETLVAHKLDEYSVIVVDHGSPRREVTQVRDAVAELLQNEWAEEEILVIPASMERRAGEQFDFNEPLLETALKNSASNSTAIIVAQLFISPGRHAGPNGDIVNICEAEIARNSQLKILRTELIGTHPLLIKLLAKRWNERDSVPFLEL